MHLTWPAWLARLAEQIVQADGKAYLVGGALRDLMLDREPNDYDLATNLLPHEVIALAERVGWRALPTGLPYGTVTVLVEGHAVEVTTFRAENHYRDGRHPESVTFGVSIEADLARRDFTMNAIALSWPDGRWVDPWDGRGDLQRRIVRAVGDAGERFAEDSLRMLRAIRLAAELEFTVEPTTRLALSVHAEGIRSVARERIATEWNRLLTAPAQGCARGLRLFFYSGIGFIIAPEFFPCLGFPQDKRYHAYTVLDHIIEVVRFTSSDKSLRWAALFHDIAKPACATTGEDGAIHFYGHDERSAEMLTGVLQRLNFDKKTIEQAALLVRHHMFPLDMGPKGVRRLLSRLGEEAMARLLELKLADMIGTGGSFIPQAYKAWRQFVERYESILEGSAALTMRDLAVNGHDVMRVLGITAGPQVGIVLKALLDEVLEQPERNEREYLLARIAVLGESVLGSGSG